MLILALTTDKLQLVTDAAATVDVHASFQDLSGTTVTPGKQNSAITTATTTDIVAAPGASTYRNVKTVHVRNKHATLSVAVTVVFDANGTDYELHKTSLLAGDSLEYIEGIGFFTLTDTAKLDVWKYVTANSVHATAATFADITDLTKALLSGKKYAIEANLFHISNATTTGAQFGYNIGAAPTVAIFGNYSGVTDNVVTAIISLGTTGTRDTAITAQTTGSAANTHTIIAGYIQPSADGNFALRATSEVTVGSALTVLIGSWMHIHEL